MQHWYRFDDNEKDIFLEGFRAGFDVTRQDFNRERMVASEGPRSDQLVADPQPQDAAKAVFRLLAARALAIAQCEHETDGTGRCANCRAEMALTAASDGRRPVHNARESRVWEAPHETRWRRRATDRHLTVS